MLIIFLFLFVNSSLNRVLVPTVLMEVKSTDGNIRSFEVNLSSYFEVQYTLAQCCFIFKA